MNIIPFNFKDSAVRVVEQEKEFYFVAKDICDILEHSNHRVAVENLDEDEKGVRKVYTPGGQQDMLCVTEPGLFKLIFRSNKPIAKEFTRWVTHEVLPSIRKKGSYSGGFTQGTLPFVDEAIEAEVFYDKDGLAVPHPSQHRYKLPEVITHAWIRTIIDLYGKRVAGNYFAPHLGVAQEAIPLPTLMHKEFTMEMVDFVEECLVKRENENVTVAAVYATYIQWGGAMSRNNFGREFSSYTGIQSVVKNINGVSTRVYEGITLKDM